MNYTLPIVINIINVAIVCVLGYSFLTFKGNQKLKFLCTLLLIANTFAMIVGFARFFIFTYAGVPEFLLFGNFGDRYTMFFAYIVLWELNNEQQFLS